MEPESWIRRLGVPALVGLALLQVPRPASAQCPHSIAGTPLTGTRAFQTSLFEITAADGGWVQGNHETGVYALHHEGALSPTGFGRSIALTSRAWPREPRSP